MILELFLTQIRQEILENAKFVVFPVIWLKFDEGKFERLITKRNPDRRLAMILASKLLFLTDFGKKLDE